MTQFVVRPAVEAGKSVVIIAEEWHTAETLARLSDSLHFLGMRKSCVLMWNANNDMSLHRVNWGRLGYVCQLTAVSRYLKHQMRALSVDPVVIPNGIPKWMLEKVPPENIKLLREAVGGEPFFFKLGRMDPDKGWLQAADALAKLKGDGARARLVMKGGTAEDHRGHFFGHASWLGLRTAEAEADILDIQTFIPDDSLPVLYAAADGVLANSGHEPLGLVGLEAMASGGIAYVGSTGEDYALSTQNAVMAMELQRDPEWAKDLRRRARETAAMFTWDEAIGGLLRKLPLMAATQMA